MVAESLLESLELLVPLVPVVELSIGVASVP
jgi:hypothetical protein